MPVNIFDIVFDFYTRVFMIQSQTFFGIVEDRNDPLCLGRCRVRIAGLHSHDRIVLPTSDLPWATCLQPVSGGSNVSATAPTEGTEVAITFYDYPECQIPVVLGIVPTIPQEQTVFVDEFESGAILKDQLAPQGRVLPLNEMEASGGTGGGPSVPSAENEVQKNIQRDSFNVNTNTKSGINETVTAQSISNNGGVGALATSLQSLGSANGNQMDKYETVLQSCGDFSKATDTFSNILAIESASKYGYDLFNGKTDFTNLMGELENLMAKSGGEFPKEVYEITNAIGLNSPSEYLTYLATPKLQKLKDDAMAKFSLTALGGVSEEALMEYGTNLVSSKLDYLPTNNGLYLGKNLADLASQVSNNDKVNSLLTNTANKASVIDSSSSDNKTVSSDVTSQIGSVAQNIMKSLGNSVGGLSKEKLSRSVLSMLSPIAGGAQALVNGLVGGSSGSSGTSNGVEPKEVASAIGKGFSVASMGNVGNLNQVESVGVTEITSEAFSGVGEGKTPPVNGKFGGPNFGGADAINEVPPKQDISRFPNGVVRAINTEYPENLLGGVEETTFDQFVYQMLDACNKHGITTVEAKSAFLAVVGCACGWDIRDELDTISYGKSAEDLMRRFPKTFGNNFLGAYMWVSASNKQLLEYVYDPSNDGARIGNTAASHASKYRGYGYLYIRGYNDYKRYSELLNDASILEGGADALSMDTCAEIAALMFLAKMKDVSPTAHPHYFRTAVRTFRGMAVGDFDEDVAESLYSYFYGAKTQKLYGIGEKVAGNEITPHSYYGNTQKDANGGDTKLGYTDPNNKYPLRKFNQEQTIPRLARGDARNTIVTLKEENRRLNVPIALSSETWSQPHSSYGAKYPYNNVRETESGHVIEVDDTPNFERIHTYHRKGTFTEIDASGTEVHRIVGDHYTIVDRNGFVSIEGDANVTVAGNVNIYCRSDANIQVEGSAEMQVGGSMNVGVAKDFNLACQGNISMWANGTFNLQSKVNGHILTGNNLYLSASNQLHEQADKALYVLSKGTTDISSVGLAKIRLDDSLELRVVKDYCQQINNDKFTLVDKNEYHEVRGTDNRVAKRDHLVTVEGNHHLKVSGSSNQTSSGSMNLKSDGSLNMQASSALNGMAGGGIAFDGATIDLNSGKAGGASDASGASESKESQVAKNAVKALVNGMVPPQLGSPINPNVKPINIAPPYGEDAFMVETPEECATNVAIASMNDMIAREGTSNTTQLEIAKAYGINKKFVESSRAQTILNTDEFTADCRLSEHFTLGMFFDGGFNNRHKLIAQSGCTEQEIVRNLSRLAENVMERILRVLPNGINGYGKTWRIASGYRMYATANNKTSAHHRGCAVDIQLIGQDKRHHWDLIRTIEPLICYDQLLLEYRGKNSVWIHIGTSDEMSANRHMAQTYVNDKMVCSGFALYA